MKNVVRFLVAAAVLLQASSPLVHAADAQAEATYQQLVKRVKQGDLSVDFRALRLACIKSGKCDPKGDSKDLIAMRKALQSKEYKETARIAESLIDAGFVNIQAHMACAEAYGAMQEPEKAKLHNEVASGLIQSILKSGDGKAKETAFEVIDRSEEYLVLGILRIPVFGTQSLVTIPPHSYDLQTRRDPQTQKEISVYFNIDAFFPQKGLK